MGWKTAEVPDFTGRSKDGSAKTCIRQQIHQMLIEDKWKKDMFSSWRGVKKHHGS